MQKQVGGCARITTPQEDRYISLVAKRNRNATPSRQIVADLAVTTGTHISAGTVSLQLNKVCLYARKPVRCISFQPCYR